MALKEFFHSQPWHDKVWVSALSILILVFAANGTAWYAAYRYVLTERQRHTQEQEAFQKETAALKEKIAALEEFAFAIGKDLSVTKDASMALADRLRAEQEKASSLETTVTKISGTVGTLEKLSKTDPELLQKYSKVFFLPEHYVPERLIDIPKNYLYHESRREQFEQRVWPHLKELLDAAAKEGVTIYIKSAYRSFNEQKDLKSAYSVTYGAGTANQFSADQGYSEHQLGTTIDFITTGLGGGFAGFDKKSAYSWLEQNAHKYGFTLSYPKGNNYYIYEPWHWRFVGKTLAERLKNENIHFYDLDQREIDKYLVNILD